MKVYICKCGFFGFTTNAGTSYGASVCAQCGKPCTDVELSTEGHAKYEAIIPGLGEYELSRCKRLQISLFV